MNGESRPRTRARGCRGRAASPRGSVSVSAPPRPCSRPAGQRLQAPRPRPAGRPARPAAPACPARGPSGPATRTRMQAPASCLARAQGPRPGGSTRPGAVATGCRKPHGPAAAISEWWPHGPVAIGTPVLSPPPHGPGVEGPPAPQRVPGEASLRASHREELGRGECKAWSSLCFKALKPAPRSCKARDRGAGGGRSRVAGGALDLEWSCSPQLRGPHVWLLAPESRWSDFGVRRRRPCGRPSAH